MNARFDTEHHEKDSGRRMKRGGIIFVCVAALLIGGCGGDNNKPAATPANPSPTVQKAIDGPVVFGTPVWTTGEITQNDTAEVVTYSDSVSELAIKVPVENVAANNSFEAKWFFNGTSLDAFTTTVATEEDVPSGWITFKLTRTTDDPWPDGQYEVVLYRDGQEMGRSSIRVEKS
jgi:hypothetical protein